MRHTDRFIPFLSLLLIIVLVVYAIGTNQYILRKDTSIAKLKENMDYYEGEEIILGIIPLEEVDEKSITVSDWNEKSKVEVSTANTTKIDGELKSGDIITILGTSYLKSKGYIEAKDVNVHKNYFWRMYLSPAGLIFLLILMHRERIVRGIYA